MVSAPQKGRPYYRRGQQQASTSGYGGCRAQIRRSPPRRQPVSRMKTADLFRQQLVSASVSTIWAIVSARMVGLVAAEIRRSVRSSGWGNFAWCGPPPSLSFDRLSYYTEIPSTPQPIFCEQTACRRAG